MVLVRLLLLCKDTMAATALVPAVGVEVEAVVIVQPREAWYAAHGQVSYLIPSLFSLRDGLQLLALLQCRCAEGGRTEERAVGGYVQRRRAGGGPVSVYGVVHAGVRRPTHAGA